MFIVRGTLGVKLCSIKKVTESKVLRVGSSFQLAFVLVQLTVELFPSTSNTMFGLKSLVIWQCEGFLHLRIQCFISFQVFVISLNSFPLGNIQRFFRLNPVYERLGTSGSPTLEEFINGMTPKFEILFELIAGNKKGGSDGIKVPGASIFRKDCLIQFHTQ